MDQSGRWRRWITAACIGISLPLGWAGAQGDSDVPGGVGARQAEFLDRGLVAVSTDAGVFLSWRLLGNESYKTGFSVYRDGKKLNRKPLTTATNYLDASGT